MCFLFFRLYSVLFHVKPAYIEVYKKGEHTYPMTQIIMYDRNTVHVDGYRRIVRFEPEQVLLSCRTCDLLIEGRALRILSFCDAEILVGGEVSGIHWLEREGR